MRTDHPYRGHAAALGTRHGKQAQLSVPLRGMVGIGVLAVDVDTDALGTFTGEVPRTLSMRDAAIAKARMAIDASGCSLALGSEGTIGPDPQLPVLTSDRELLVLVDAGSEAIISASARDFHVVAASALLGPDAELEPFLARAQFPRHRLTVRPHGIEPAQLPAELRHKGIADRSALAFAIRACAEASPTGQARVESDLRAHCSPSRQAVIARVAWSLGYRLTRRCPLCAAPGWGQVDSLRGLPCGLCGTWSPAAVRGQVLGCGQCGHQQERPDGRLAQDPADCPSCNP